MILKRYTTLNYISSKQVLLSAIIGLAVLPGTSVANKSRLSAMSSQDEQHISKSFVSSAPKLSGKAAFNYVFDDTGTYKIRSKRKYGEWRFSHFSLRLNGAANDIHYKVEYAWYQPARLDTGNTIYHTPLEMYLGHTFDNGVVGQVGNTMVPFGISNNLSWWKNIPFYAGFGDNYKPGFKLIYHRSPWSFQLQLGKDHLLYDGNNQTIAPKLSGDRYNIVGNPNPSTDVAGDNLQANARVTYLHHLNDNTKVELGLSGKVGNVYNDNTSRKSTLNAVAAHLNGCWNKLQAQLQFMPYNYSWKNSIANLQSNTLQLSKDNRTYTIPTKANIDSFGLAYKLPVNWGKIEEITVYEDYSVLSGKRTAKRSKLNIIGAKFMTGPLFLSADVVSGKNMFGIGEQRNGNDTNNIGANNNNNNDWKTKFNVNFGAKF